METLHSLSQSVQQITSALAQLSAPSSSTSPPVSNPPATLPSVSPKEPWVPTPEPYAGEPGSCSRFLLNCTLVFDLQPASYSTDKAKIAFCVNLLRGKAAQWATALWTSHSAVLSSFLIFSTELRKVFDHPVKGLEAMNRLFLLRQGSGSVADFSIEFRILAAECGWDEPALMTLFSRNLSEELKDELASRDDSTSLEQLIALAIRLDNRLQERRRERAERTRKPVPSAGLRFSVPAPTCVPASPSWSPARPSAPQPPSEEPMQLGRARLSPSERQRRMQLRLCLYCGLAGHYAANCRPPLKDLAHQ